MKFEVQVDEVKHPSGKSIRVPIRKAGVRQRRPINRSTAPPDQSPRGRCLRETPRGTPWDTLPSSTQPRPAHVEVDASAQCENGRHPFARHTATSVRALAAPPCHAACSGCRSRGWRSEAQGARLLGVPAAMDVISTTGLLVDVA